MTFPTAERYAIRWYTALVAATAATSVAAAVQMNGLGLRSSP